MRITCKYYFLLFVLSAILNNEVIAQENSPQKEKSKEYERAYFGLGASLDYGGLGIKGEILPVKWVGVFVGFGYNFVEPAFNAGLSVKVSPDKKITPTVLAMYGYNAVIRIKSGMGFPDIHGESYYGVSIGVGAEIKYGINKNKINVALLVPFRNSDFQKDYDKYDDNLKHKILPFVLSLGVNFALGMKVQTK